MATDRQEKLAEEIVANKLLPIRKRKNKAQLLVSAGYSEITAKANPSLILEQKGVKETLAKYGLTEGLITEALVHDIKAKPRKRVKELSLGADILGMKNNEKPNATYNTIVFTGEQERRIAERIVNSPESEEESN